VEALFGPNDRSLDIAAIGSAVLLLVLVRLLLPKTERSRARIAAVYLGLALVFGGLSWVVDPRATVHRAFLFLYYFFVLASSGRSIVLLAVDVVFGRRIHRAPPRIFRDLTQAVVYVIVLMLTLRGIGVEPGSLLTTSALLTAVIGLALQDTLGNLVSGLALQMQRPFEVGDWIQFETDEKTIGQVTEVNWRATTLLTNDLVEVIVPNGVLARASIRNFTQPSTVSRRSVEVAAPYGVAPKRVHDAILAALPGTPGVLADPAPWVQTKKFADSGIEYVVWFFINDFATRPRIDGAVRDRVWYALQRAAIDIPFPIRTVHMHQMSEESEKRDRDRELERRDKVLRCVDFLDVLTPDVHRTLAAATTKRMYAPGEIIVRQGEPSAELFIIDQGTVVVEVTSETGKTRAVAKLGAGKFFGEMALMTGEPRSATVRAETECELLVVGHAAFHDTLAAVPGLVEKISDLLATRQAELEVVTSQRPSVHELPQDRSRRLISQIKTFFKL
jgi:small-conductance mechanosensitive channel/CRP-like cAMP-binding protein